METSLSIGMTYKQRRKETIGKSLNSLRNAGFTDPVYIFSEPNPGVIPEGITVLQNETNLGCSANFLNALSWLVKNTDSEYLAIVQDDVVYYRNAKEEWLKHVAITKETNRNVGYWSLYLATKHRDLTVGKDYGFLYHEIGWCFWGALAYIFTRQSATDLINDDQFISMVNGNHKNVDCAVGTVLLKQGKRCYFSYPSLTNHIGTTSTVGHKHFHMNDGYKFLR